VKEKVSLDNVNLSGLNNRDFVESFCDVIEKVYGQENRKRKWKTLVENVSLSDNDREVMETMIFATPYFQFSIFNSYNFCTNPNVFIDVKGFDREKLQEILQNFYGEALERGLNIALDSNISNKKEFYDWCKALKNNPKYISEIMSNKSGIETYIDAPVRRATSILNKKGYVTFMSSANVEDTKENRYGVIIPNKNVAFILIDPKNLTEELKKKLLISSKKKNDYYGIWTELKPYPQEELCSDVSKRLETQAQKLPVLPKLKSQQQVAECFRSM